MACIRIQVKKNIGYLIVYFFGSLLRKILCVIIKENFDITLTYIYLYLMILGEIMGGLLIFLYQYNSKRKRKEIKYFGLNLIYYKNIARDGNFKKALLICFASFFDILDYVYSNMYHPSIFSECVDLRLSSTQTIASALIFIYAFKYKMKKHHKVSLIALGLCLCLSIIIDVIFKNKYISLKTFFFSYFVFIFSEICFSFNNCIEKYLFDVDYMNPFQILLFEGLFGVIFSLIASINPNSRFKDIIENNIKETGRLILLIFLLFIYFLLSMIVNAYKVYANITFLPMARSLIEYILNPIFNIYFFIMKLDFNDNYYSFFLSEILCIIISLFGCVYNEYIILSFCGLDNETDFAIKERANQTESLSLSNIDDSSSSNYDED